MTQQEYIERRESLIPEAKRYADQQAGEEPELAKDKRNDLVYDGWANTWNFAFHSMMDLLAVEEGLMA